MNIRVRIAPSPTGEPHIGTAYSALFNFAFARKEKGKFILRIEDTDQTRLVKGSEKNITDSLKWLGFWWDEGPDVGGDFGPYRQSERLSIYKKNVAELVKKKKAYWCDCSLERLKKIREDQQKKGEVPHYDRRCREMNLNEGKNTVARFAVPGVGETNFEDPIRGLIKFQNKDIDDSVIYKSDGYPTYHLASVVDDHLMQISHVIRAEEWLSSTPKHVLLYQAFGWYIPKFVHLPLLRNTDRSKISKRKNPVSLIWYRQQGYLSEALLNFLANMGWSMPSGKEIFTVDEFIQNLSFARIDPSGPIFDLKKLDWMNGEYIRKTQDDNLLGLLKNYTSRNENEIKKVLPLIKERMKKLSEFDSLTGFIFSDEIRPDLREVVKKYDNKQKSEALQKVGNELERVSQWISEEIEKAIESERLKLGWGKSDLYMLIRVAVSASTATPPLFETMEVIGKEKVLKRFKASSKMLSK